MPTSNIWEELEGIIHDWISVSILTVREVIKNTLVWLMANTLPLERPLMWVYNGILRSDMQVDTTGFRDILKKNTQRASAV